MLVSHHSSSFTRVCAVLATALFAVGCFEDRTLPSQPGRSSAPLSVALAARIVGSVPSQLDVRVYYLRTDGSTGDLANRTFPLSSGTQRVELTVNPQACIEDPQHLPAASGADACVLGGVLTTLDGTTRVDSAAFLPIEAAPGDVRDVPEEIVVGGEWRQVSVGAVSVCAINRDWGLYCWGNNDVGQLGSGVANSAVPIRVAPPLRFAAVDAGPLGACGLTPLGRAYCWGNDEYGSLGRGARATERCSTTALRSTDEDFTGPFACSRTPLPVSGTHLFRSVSVGFHHTCGLDASGTAYCWGADILLGDGSFAGVSDTTDITILPKPFPSLVLGGRTYTTISAGLAHTCTIVQSGQPFCWGFDDNGRAGFEVESDAPDISFVALAPIRVAGETSLRSISAGDETTCGISERGDTYCWGGNEFLQLGHGGTRGDEESVFMPTSVAIPGSMKAVASGWRSTCAIATTGAAYCWGSHERGALGIGTSAPSQCTRDNPDAVGVLTFPCASTPSRVTGTLVFATIDVGLLTACGLTQDHALYCWGDDTYGQLGAARPSAAGFVSAPVAVRAPTRSSAVATLLASTSLRPQPAEPNRPAEPRHASRLRRRIIVRRQP